MGKVSYPALQNALQSRHNACDGVSNNVPQSHVKSNGRDGVTIAYLGITPDWICSIKNCGSFFKQWDGAHHLNTILHDSRRHGMIRNWISEINCFHKLMQLLLIKTIILSSKEIAQRLRPKAKKHYLGRASMLNKNKILSYCQTLRYVQIYWYKHNWKVVLHYVKLIKPLFFHTRFLKSGPTHRKQVVNPRFHTPQGQSVVNPWIPLKIILIEKLNMTQRSHKSVCSIQYSKIQCHYASLS